MLAMFHLDTRGTVFSMIRETRSSLLRTTKSRLMSENGRYCNEKESKNDVLEHQHDVVVCLIIGIRYPAEKSR
jgi:hypothetical protein